MRLYIEKWSHFCGEDHTKLSDREGGDTHPIVQQALLHSKSRTVIPLSYTKCYSLNDRCATAFENKHKQALYTEFCPVPIEIRHVHFVLPSEDIESGNTTSSIFIFLLEKKPLWLVS